MISNPCMTKLACLKRGQSFHATYHLPCIRIKKGCPSQCGIEEHFFICINIDLKKGEGFVYWKMLAFWHFCWDFIFECLHIDGFFPASALAHFSLFNQCKSGHKLLNFLKCRKYLSLKQCIDISHKNMFSMLDALILP